MTAERFLLRWMWPYLKVHMDRDQFGGIARNSVSHYLIELTNFILYNMDLSTPLITIMTMVDFSKGFNRVHHAALINELYSLGIPAWILRIVRSYLSNRQLRIRYKEGISEPARLPGGLGQGTLMGIWMFLVKMNNFSNRSDEEHNIGEIITKTSGRRQIPHTKKKWVDDLTEVSSVNISEVVDRVRDELLIRPLNFHARTGHRLKINNPAQDSLNDIYQLANKSYMVVN